ncbi:DISARM system helicase DrmA [Virgibacillus dokdonensis]|uniref:DISARM system helicase DrmA n=1 Tax=Virgibacillus dokdonensis TaxID=302167 RepID=UPI0015906529|nr:DISARM system helicase DrmA [Virgibacillus dokdonensis]
MSEESRKRFALEIRDPEKPEGKNAWLVRVENKEQVLNFSLILDIPGSECKGVHEGDPFLIFCEMNKSPVLIAFARLYRKRSTLTQTTFYFDGYLPVENHNTLDLKITSSVQSPIKRIDWEFFEEKFNGINGFDFSSFPILTGEFSNEQAYVRSLLENAVIDDLLGPADGPFEEIIGMSVRDRYLVGRLAPKETIKEEFDDPVLAKTNVNSSGASGRTDDEENTGGTDTSTNQSLVPSSVGITFCVDGSVKKLEILASWGRYIRGKSDKEDKNGKPFRAWKRVPSGGKKEIVLTEGKITPFSIDGECPEVLIQGTVYPRLENGDRLVTLFLVNTQLKPEQNQDTAWVFQPELVLRDPEGKDIFRRRPMLKNDEESDIERKSLEMVYRNQVEFAVGHGISVHAKTTKDNSSHSTEVRTSVLPSYEIPVTETPGSEPEDRPTMQQMVEKGFLDMDNLASMEQDELCDALSVLTNDYQDWIQEQRERIGNSIKGFDNVAHNAMDRCEEILRRLREGITVLGTDVDALASFRFANKAMAYQRIRSIYSLKRRRGVKVDYESLDIRKNRSWRPFQLAFMLLSIPSLTDPAHKDRTDKIEAYADLLWFPTGGGKTEAYLGVAAFTMAIRRRQGKLGGLDASRGLSVVMRYTLRLLTLQQFQRATTLLCSMEILRKNNTKEWGNNPFTIGLWVGKKVTPNTTEQSHEAIESERDGKRGSGSTPAQLTSCPWCGSEISPGRDIQIDKVMGKTFIFCGDKYGRCEFSRAKSREQGLPVLVVDEEIYRNPPSMLIATVDKFALMAWRGEIKTLFGYVTHECPRHGLIWSDSDCSGQHPKKGKYPVTNAQQVERLRPPDLIIQDEFHLISGPLGTMVGLYETAVDSLSTWSYKGKDVKPKVIASTATVKKAEEQVTNVFLRHVSIFPPQGLDIEDNFFSVQRSKEQKPGRRYVGICSPGSSRPAVLIRVYVALLTAAQSLYNHFGQVADPYMTLVGYFNSLRELGGMRRLAEDDVQTRSYRVQMSEIDRPGLSQRKVQNIDELTSRTSSREIPKILDKLELNFKPKWGQGEPQAIDIALATNMLSVGVDVNRLGLMVVNGQPKGTAEYIQSTSRVGRSSPGLVFSVLTWSRPRDISHYETFEHYHSSFYKHVEAQSVTPFAPRALDRGLTGTIVSHIRLKNDGLNPNVGAQNLDDTSNTVAEIVRQVVTNRAWNIKNDRSIAEKVEEMIKVRIDSWVKESIKPGRKLGYEAERKKGDLAPLLQKPGIVSWDKFTVPMSMREVEPGVQLIMDVDKLPDAPEWQLRKKKEQERNNDETGDLNEYT